MVERNTASIKKRFHVFISHASEDKDFVTPLACALRDAGLRVWYDEFELQIGDSINQKISEGLSQSQFGIVVLSPSFFRKHWTQHEINGLIARQMSGERLILPIWHRITRDEIVDQSPALADIFSLNSATQDLESIVQTIIERIEIPSIMVASENQPRIARSEHAGPNFGIFYIAQEHTEELSPRAKPDISTLTSFDAPQSWVSVVHDDDELEYLFEGSKLRIRLDYRNRWQGDEIVAHRLLTGSEPFALIIRPNGSKQIYLSSVVNSSPSRQTFGDQNRSGWLVLEIQ